MPTYTKDNNLLLATIHFMNESNYRNAISGAPSVWSNITGTVLRDRKRSELNRSKSQRTMLLQRGPKGRK